MARLVRRARAKFMSLPLSTALAELRSPLERSYRNTVYCAARFEGRANGDGTVTLRGRYCGNRWCLVCARVRAGNALNRYLPVIRGWDAPHFVTLTVRNCPAAELPGRIADMIAAFQAVKLAMRRTDGVKLVAVRKLECTYNAQADTYHPHFHVVVNGAAAAALLRSRWLKAWPDDAVGEAQDVRPCNPSALPELFKYFTKIITKTRRSGQSSVSTSAIFAAPLDVIFRAMQRKRVWQPVGFKLPADDTEQETPEQLEERDAVRYPGGPAATGIVWQWDQRAADWRSGAHRLSGYEPGAGMRRLVDGIAASATDGSLDFACIRADGDRWLVPDATGYRVGPAFLERQEGATTRDMMRARMRALTITDRERETCTT